MDKMLRTFCAALFLTALISTPTLNLGMVQDSDAQVYVPEAGFELAWSLDPRSDADLFPGDPYFGGRGVQVGMDLDNDGNLEILFTTDPTIVPGGPDPGVLAVYLYENDGDNSYVPVWHYIHTVGSNSFPALTYGDIDEDGLWEIYLGIPTIGDATDLFIFEQGTDLVFPDTPTATWDYEREAAADFRPSAFQLADVDGDGKIELVTTSRTGGNRELVVASLAGALDAFATWTIEYEVGNDILGGGSIYDASVFDFDNDGLMEIWVNTWDNFSLSIFEATGADTYALQADINGFITVDDPGSVNAHDFQFKDIDSDGRAELIYPMSDGIYYYLEDVDDVSTIEGSSFARVGRFGPQSRGADAGDVDGDGLLDIIVGTATDEKIMRIEYLGSGDPADSTNYEWSLVMDSSADTLGERWYPLRIADVDLDGDNKREIVLTNLYASFPGQAIIVILEANSTVAVEPIDSELPRELALKTNYPNPFSNSTTIEYAVTDAGNAKVEVYNLMGQRVKTLVDESHQPGNYRTEWDGTNDAGQRVSSGVYLYSLEADGARQSRRLSVIR